MNRPGCLPGLSGLVALDGKRLDGSGGGVPAFAGLAGSVWCEARAHWFAAMWLGCVYCTSLRTVALVVFRGGLARFCQTVFVI